MEFVDHKDSANKALLDKVKEEDRLGMHSFHRYYGKLIPAIPRAYIRKFTEKGDLVFDPFSGSGTTALEAKFADRNFAGIEINPLSILIDEIKLANYDVSLLNKVFEKIVFLFENDTDPVEEEEIPFCVNRDHWFKDFVQKDLVRLKRNIPLAVDALVSDDKTKYEKFYLGVLSAIVKQVSNADTMHVFPGIKSVQHGAEIRKLHQLDRVAVLTDGEKTEILRPVVLREHEGAEGSGVYDFSQRTNRLLHLVPAVHGQLPAKQRGQASKAVQ